VFCNQWKISVLHHEKRFILRRKNKKNLQNHRDFAELKTLEFAPKKGWPTALIEP